MSDYIKNQYDIDNVKDYFTNWVFQKFVLRPVLHQVSQTRKKGKPLKKITDLANNPNAILVFQDEVHYTVQTRISSMWAIKSSKPKVKSYPGKDNISYSGFIIPSTGELFTCKPEWFNYETTISSIRTFLKSNSLPENHKYYLIMDNAPWHKKAKRLISITVVKNPKVCYNKNGDGNGKSNTGKSRKRNAGNKKQNEEMLLQQIRLE